MRLVMTLKVRDEADVIEANLRYHHAQGVDFFVVTDNGSVDGTLDVLTRYRDAGLLHLIQQPSDRFRFEARRWVTHMARQAATDFGADWVINNDADEFWWPLAGDLKQALAGVPDRYAVVTAPRPEFIARPDGPEPFHERLVVREARSHLRPKVAHRALPDVKVGRGSHFVDLKGYRAASGHSSRAVLRGVTDALPTDRAALVPAPIWPLRVLHFPVRSFAQYSQRVDITLYKGAFPVTSRRRTLREHVEEGRLRELYDGLVLDDAAVQTGLDDGSLVRDTSLRDFLVACPDPLAGSGQRVAVLRPAPAPHELEAELAANAFDAMHATDRTERLMRRRRQETGRRVKDLQRQLDWYERRLRDVQSRAERLASRLAAIEGRPWRRLAGAVDRSIRRGRDPS